MRRRRQRRPWWVDYLEQIDSDPAGFAASVHGLTNGAAFVKGLELATAARQADLAGREAELERREQALRDAERLVEGWEQWTQAAEAAYFKRQEEVKELERVRDELREELERGKEVSR